jgi:hypothetical protein
MELAVHQNKIINTFDKIGSREKERASDAGEDREEIGKLLDLTNLNKKAVSFCRMLHKQEPDKRADIIRSLKPLLDLMEKHWDGQNTPDMFTGRADEPAEPEGQPESTYEGSNAEIAAEDAAFEAHLANVEAAE